MTVKTKTKKKSAPADAKIEQIKTKHIQLEQITSNTAQSRGMGVLSRLTDMGCGLFEKTSVDKEPIWELLFSDKPEDRAHGCMLLEENEPELVALAESRRNTGTLEPVGVWQPTDDTFDVIYGMRRCLADAYNAAKYGETDQTEAKVFTFDKEPTLVQLKVLALTENLNRKDESPIDRALTYKELRGQGLTDQQIGERTQQSGRNVANYLKLLHPLLKDKRAAIHMGKLKVEPALKLLEKLQKGENGEERDKGGQERLRFPSMKLVERILTTNKFPKGFDEKLAHFFKQDTIREFLAYVAGIKNPKPYEEVELDKPGPRKGTKPSTAATKVDEDSTPATSGKKLRIKRKRAQDLLVSLGKTTARSWSDDILKEKLENMPNILEDGQTAENESLQKLLDKLVAGYKSGIQVEITDD